MIVSDKRYLSDASPTVPVFYTFFKEGLGSATFPRWRSALTEQDPYLKETDTSTAAIFSL